MASPKLEGNAMIDLFLFVGLLVSMGAFIHIQKQSLLIVFMMFPHRGSALPKRVICMISFSETQIP